MKTLAMILAAAVAAGILCSASPAQKKAPVPTGDEMVDVVHILNDSLTRGHAGHYIDGRIASQDEVGAIHPSRVQSTTILRGGRPYIDEQIQKILAGAPKPAPSAPETKK